MDKLKIFAIELSNDLAEKVKGNIRYFWRNFKSWTGLKANDWCVKELEKRNDVPRCAWCNHVARFKQQHFLKGNKLYFEIEFNGLFICDDNKECERHKLNPNSFDFVSKSRGLTKEEGKQYLYERNSSPFYRTNFNSDEEYSRSQTRDKQWFIENFENGEEKYIERNTKTGIGNKKESLIKKYGKEQAEKICKNKDTNSKEYFKKKYGDEWEKYFNLHKEKIIQTEEAYIKRFGFEEGIKKWQIHSEKLKQIQSEIISKMTPEERKLRDTCSKDSFKRRFGNEWEKHYRKFQEKIQTNAGKASKASLKFFEKIISFLNKAKIPYNIGVNGNKEYFLWDKELKKLYLYDLCIPSLKLIIEYHGSLFHYNKNKLLENPFGKTLNERKEHDLRKESVARSYGFDYYAFFDTDDRFVCSKQIIDVIKGKLNEKTK